MRSCMLNVWQGPYPKIWHLTGRSGAKQGIDKYIVIADTPPPKMYPNMEFVKMSMEDINERVRKIIPEFKGLPHAYKICDLRPLFYWIFNDIIKDYDCFMWTDMDAMYGNYDLVKNLISDDVEIISHYDRIGGYWTWFKNDYFSSTQEKWFKEFSEDLDFRQKICDTEKHHCLDERWFSIAMKRVGAKHVGRDSLQNHKGIHPAVRYIDGRLLQVESDFEIYSYHFHFLYRWAEVERLSIDVFENDSLLIDRPSFCQDVKNNELIRIISRP
jgi:hypothetical protein